MEVSQEDMAKYQLLLKKEIEFKEGNRRRASKKLIKLKIVIQKKKKKELKKIKKGVALWIKKNMLITKNFIRLNKENIEIIKLGDN